MRKSVMTAAAFGLILFAAAPAPASGDEPAPDVTFKGGCGLIGITASSKPDKKSMDVDKNTEVSFKNDLGANATLYVGSDTVDVEKGETVDVKVEKSAEVKMLPKCWYGRALLEDMNAMTVSVKNSPEPPAPAKPSPSSAPAKKPSKSATSSAPGVPAAGAQPSIDPHRPVAEGAVPPDSGEAAPTGAPPTPIPTAPAQQPADHEGDAFAVEPVNDDATPSGSTGLLALIATVALVGVGAAAVRTVASQRGSNTA